MYIQITLRKAGQIVLCLADRLLAVVKIEIIIIVFDTIFPENEVNGKTGNGIIYPLYAVCKRLLSKGDFIFSIVT